jgi:signal transduction histidine kinase
VIEQKIVGVACVCREDVGFDILESEEFALWAKLLSLAIEKSSEYKQTRTRLEITREELRRSQQQRIRSEKLSSLAEIARSVAHTIRNPVTIIGGLSHRLCRDLPDDDPKRLEFQMIMSEASRLEEIVKEFNRFFTIEQISFKYEDVNRMVEAVLEEFLFQHQAEQNLSLEKVLWSKPLMCCVDSALLERCLTHLLDNAREASDKKVHISLTTFQEGQEAIIDVTDLGKGMSQKEVDHVFDPFFSTKDQRLGMGLAFVHFVISEHGGQIEVTSVKGSGTRFRIRLSLAPCVSSS